jgi:hypothetical protein
MTRPTFRRTELASLRREAALLAFRLAGVVVAQAFGSVQSVMRSFRQDNQILKTIVLRVVVQVMDVFIALKQTAKMRFHDQTVLWNIPVFVGTWMVRAEHVAVAILNARAALPTRIQFTPWHLMTRHVAHGLTDVVSPLRSVRRGQWSSLPTAAQTQSVWIRQTTLSASHVLCFRRSSARPMAAQIGLALRCRFSTAASARLTICAHTSQYST